jgi:hypothetical protein
VKLRIELSMAKLIKKIAFQRNGLYNSPLATDPFELTIEAGDINVTIPKPASTPATSQTPWSPTTRPRTESCTTRESFAARGERTESCVIRERIESWSTVRQ